MDPRRASDPLGRILGEIPPASGAMVMGTGIVSIALSLDGHETLSRILLVICAVAWVLLGAFLVARLRLDSGRVEREARSPAAVAGRLLARFPTGEAQTNGARPYGGPAWRVSKWSALPA